MHSIAQTDAFVKRVRKIFLPVLSEETGAEESRIRENTPQITFVIEPMTYAIFPILKIYAIIEKMENCNPKTNLKE